MGTTTKKKEKEHDQLVKDKFEEILTKLDDMGNANQQIINKLEQIMARLPNQ